MKDNEKKLIAAFESCAKLDCLSCPFIRDFESCDRLEESILDLINSQKTEIERLQKYNRKDLAEAWNRRANENR